MARPTVSQSAEDLYTVLAPLALEDEQNGWALLVFCEAIAGPLELVRTYSENQWRNLVDIDETPNEALPWLAQLAGVVPPKREDISTDAEYYEATRAYIKNTPSYRRGSLAAIVSAAQRYLTGDKTVIVRERWGGAYKLDVRTVTSETTSSAKVLAAINEHKPAGIILTYGTITGQDYGQLLANYATYQLVFTSFLTYQGVLTNTPGT